MGNRLGSRSDGEMGPELGVRRSSWRGVFSRRKPVATFLDYEGTSFDNYLQQKSSTLISQTRSLRNSLEGFPLRRNRSASTGDQDRLYPLSRAKESQAYLTSSEDMSEHIYSNLVPEPSYESLHPVTTSETLPTLPTTTRRLLFSTERQVSHNEEEALELAPEYICVPTTDRFEDTEESVTFDESSHDYGEDRSMLDEGVERVKVAPSTKPHVTFERGAEVGDKCPARCGKRRVGRGQEAIYLQPCDHLASPPRPHHPPTLSNVTSGAHLPKVNTLGFQWGGCHRVQQLSKIEPWYVRVNA